MYIIDEPWHAGSGRENWTVVLQSRNGSPVQKPLYVDRVKANITEM